MRMDQDQRTEGWWPQHDLDPQYLQKINLKKKTGCAPTLTETKLMVHSGGPRKPLSRGNFWVRHH